jgi:NitT/TauT family transport system permease protein
MWGLGRARMEDGGVNSLLRANPYAKHLSPHLRPASRERERTETAAPTTHLRRLSAQRRAHYRDAMVESAPAASPNVVTAAASGPRGESRALLIARTAFPFLVLALAWEFTAHLGIFPRRLFPPLEEVAAALVRLTADGILPHHVWDTLVRLLAGFALAALFGIAIGFAMGRSRRAEDVFLPLVSIGAPIPGLAYAPLFLLWFGLGNKSAVLLVGFVSAFPVIFNTWTGVKAVKEIWVRSAQAMGADSRRLLRQVILPGALPYILTGLRLGLAQAWRILVGVEMLAAVPWGLGWMIFGAREFLNTDVMLAGVVVIGAIGLALEKLVFARLEQFTVVRWGMMS